MERTMCATYFAHLRLLDLIIAIIYSGDQFMKFLVKNISSVLYQVLSIKFSFATCFQTVSVSVVTSI